MLTQVTGYSLIISKIAGYVLALISVALIIVGDKLIYDVATERRSYLDTLFSKEVLYCTILYGLGGPVWATIMWASGSNLPQIGIMYGSLTLLGLAVLGVLWYGDILGRGQIVAVPLILIAIVISEIWE